MFDAQHLSWVSMETAHVTSSCIVRDIPISNETHRQTEHLNDLSTLSHSEQNARRITALFPYFSAYIHKIKGVKTRLIVVSSLRERKIAPPNF